MEIKLPKWLKYVISLSSGFGIGAGTAVGSGSGTKGLLIGGALGVISSLSNLRTTSPTDHSALGRDN